jgi:SH3 domain protein
MMLVAALIAPMARAEADPRPQYISDDVTVSLRDRADTDAATNGTVHSGDRVSVLESKGAGSFARVRSADGREGWIPERYLTPTPAARERLEAVQKQLEDAQAQVQSIKLQFDVAQQQLAQVKPAVEMAAQNDQLRSKLESAERELNSYRGRDEEDFQRRQTLLYGGGLVAGGLLFGLILPWLTRQRRRRYSDF